VKVKVIQY